MSRLFDSSKRSRQRAVARLLIAALLWPLLSGAVQALTSPDDGLARALALSLCASGEAPAPSDGPLPHRDHACVLCVGACGACGAVPPEPVVVAGPTLHADPVAIAATDCSPWRRSPLKSGSSSRGPPSDFST